MRVERNTEALARRAIDIVVAFTLLLMTLPLLLLAALAIVVSSRGAILFSQERIGQSGRPFRLFKLRTMIPEADALKDSLERAIEGSKDGVRFKLRCDPRTTRVGRILRRFSVDELPQLWNVVRGDMSLIGPRPAVWREVEKYGPRELRRLEVKPGLTCLWQVSGRSELSFETQVELDLTYIDRGDLKSDLLILLRTVPAVLTGRGAY